MLEYYIEIIDKIGFGEEDSKILLTKGIEIIKNFDAEIKEIIEIY